MLLILKWMLAFCGVPGLHTCNLCREKLETDFNLMDYLASPRQPSADIPCSGDIGVLSGLLHYERSCSLNSGIKTMRPCPYTNSFVHQIKPGSNVVFDREIC